MSLLYPGRITKLEIGLSAATNTDITNMILMNWERNHDVRPRLYANLKYPTTYQQPHSWIIGSFSLLSDNHDAIYATAVNGSGEYAMVPDDDSNVIDYFKVTYEDEDGNSRITRFFYPIIYRHNKELLNYEDSVWIYHFMAGYAVDSSQELNLLSATAETPDVIHTHSGITCATTASCVLAGGIQARGLTVTPTGNLVILDEGSQSLLFMDGISCSVSTSCSLPASGGWGLTLDNDENLISGSDTTASIYIHAGLTCTVSTSFSSPDGEPRGLTVDSSGNLISGGSTDESIFIHVGVTSTISTSFSTPGSNVTGLTLDGDGNLVSGDAGTDSIYIHDGVTDTITSSCSFAGNVQGLTTSEI